MKKTMLSLVVLMVVAGFAFAQTQQATQTASQSKATVVKTTYTCLVGKIVSIDKEKNTFVLQVNKTNEEKTLSADAKIINTLQVNKDIKAYCKLDTTVVVKVKVLKTTATK